MLSYCVRCGKIAEWRHTLCRECFNKILGKYKCPKCNTILDYQNPICIYCGKDCNDTNKAL